MKMSVWQTQYLFSGQSAVQVQQNVSAGWQRVGQDVFLGRPEHRSSEPFTSSPPSCTRCIDALAASGAGEAAAWHHSDDLLPELHELRCFPLLQLTNG